MSDYGFLRTQTAEPTVADLMAVLDSQNRHPERIKLPPLVHVHPDETVAQAIEILREYDVSQLPVVRQEPPLMAAEVASAAAATLEKSGAALVHVDGKPAAVLTRQDLLAYYAEGPR